MNKLRILGVDPGSRITGYGIVEIQNNKNHYIDSGCIRLGSGAMPARLHQIFHSLSEIIQTYQPAMLVIESVFMHKNPDSAIKLGQARGAAICAGANNALAVHEYSPKQIKQAVVGKGGAEKSQVQEMVKILLNLSAAPQADAADALAVALCHAHTQQTYNHIPAQHVSRGRMR